MRRISRLFDRIVPYLEEPEMILPPCKIRAK